MNIIFLWQDKDTARREGKTNLFCKSGKRIVESVAGFNNHQAE